MLIDYAGKHTAVSHLAAKEWKNVPILRDNKGALPPFIIAVGDSRRVEHSLKILDLKNAVFLHDAAEKLIGLKGRGRVNMLLGIFVRNKQPIPLLVFETQMGMPATEINLREVLAHSSKKYKLLGAEVASDSLNVIRVGTAGGINRKDRKGTRVRPGDIVSASFTMGWSGTNLESLAGLDFSSGAVIAKFKKEWKKRGFNFTKDGAFPVAGCSEKLRSSIASAAKNLKLSIKEGGNFSKDSLYAETDEKNILELRKKYGIICTEMEQMAIMKVASDFKKAGIDVNAGLISGIIGATPGQIFVGDNDPRIKRLESSTLKLAAVALWNMLY